MPSGRLESKSFIVFQLIKRGSSQKWLRESHHWKSEQEIGGMISQRSRWGRRKQIAVFFHSPLFGVSKMMPHFCSLSHLVNFVLRMLLQFRSFPHSRKSFCMCCCIFTFFLHLVNFILKILLHLFSPSSSEVRMSLYL